MARVMARKKATAVAAALPAAPATARKPPARRLPKTPRGPALGSMRAAQSTDRENSYQF